MRDAAPPSTPARRIDRAGRERLLRYCARPPLALERLHQVRPVLIGYALTGFFNCILWFIPQLMLADVADESELITGSQREGAHFGIFSFGQQIAAGVGLLLAGALLEWFAGLKPGEAQRSDLTVHRIGIASSVVPAMLFLAAAMVILGYKLTRSRVVSIQAELHERRVRAGTAGE